MKNTTDSKKTLDSLHIAEHSEGMTDISGKAEVRDILDNMGQDSKGELGQGNKQACIHDAGEFGTLDNVTGKCFVCKKTASQLDKNLPALVSSPASKVETVSDFEEGYTRAVREDKPLTLFVSEQGSTYKFFPSGAIKNATKKGDAHSLPASDSPAIAPTLAEEGYTIEKGARSRPLYIAYYKGERIGSGASKSDCVMPCPFRQ